MRNITRISLIISLSFMTACGSISGFIGSGTAGYESYKSVSYVKSAVDIGLASKDKKTTDDMFLSSITGYDCKLKRLLDGGLETICKKWVPLYDER
jgi:hypothetical protein